MTQERRNGATGAKSKLTLGPLLFNWQPEARRDFYFRIADEAPVDTVYIGEVTCSKRTPFFTPFIPEVCERLEAAGKEVVLSTLALVMSKRERDELLEMAADSPWPVEANDLSAIAHLQGRPHVVGPFINLYNEGTVRFLVEQGASRLVLPCELPSTSIGALCQAACEANEQAEVEVQVFGRLPLALSARCYHARSHGLTKDGCLYVCDKDPDGMDVDTLDGKPFLAVNGIQTMSYTVHSLLRELQQLQGLGVSHFRLWPHDTDMVAVARQFRDALDGEISPEEALVELENLIDFAPFSNGFYHGVEGTRMVE